jgi:DNA-binding response OmpR family regulator
MSQPSSADPQGHILLVEPEPLRQAEYRAFFEAREFRVTACGTAAEARAHPGQPNYVLSALDLPDQPGWHLVAHFETRNPAPLMVFWGSDPDAWHRLSFRDNSRVLFLPEPFHGDQLILALYLLEGNQVF